MIRKVKSRKSTKAKAATKVQPLTKSSASVKTKFPVLKDFFDYDWKNVRVLAVKRRDREPPFDYPPLTSYIFFTEALNEIGDSI
jgi:hypothetical protein